METTDEGTEGEGDVISIGTPRATRAKTKAPPKTPAQAVDPFAGIMRDGDMMEAADLKEYLDGLCASNSDMQFSLSREMPRIYKGTPIAGAIDKYTEPPDQDFIREAFGGGSYKLVIHRREADGKMKYFKMRRFAISGDPVLNNLPGHVGKDDAPAAPVADGRRAETAVLNLLSSEVERMRQAQPSGFDPAMIQMIQAPLLAQMEAINRANQKLQEQLQEKADAAMHAATVKPDTHFQDNMIEKLFTSDATRLESMREAHASELRQLRENHRDELRKVKDDHSDAIKAIDQRWERVITAVTGAKDTESKMIGSSKDTEIRSLEAGYTMQIKMLDREIGQLRTELAKSEGEVGALRAVKDKSIVERAQEIKEIREALGSDDEKEEGGIGGTLVSIVNSVLENPEAIGDLLGMRKTQPEAPVENVQVRRQQQRVLAAQKKVQAQGTQVVATVVQPAADGTVPVVAAPPAPKLERPAESDIKLAATFIENAIRSGKEPEEFAESTRALVPRNVMAYLQAVGIDEFLGNVSSLDAASPLRTQAGRNWIRKVAKYLMEGVTE